MSTTEQEGETPSTKSQTISLERLFLDPNNYRFIDLSEYRKIPDEQVMDKGIQRRTSTFLLGKRKEKVSELIASFRQSGWLTLDRILVRQIKNGHYLVVEGNRRVATLKHLQREHQDSSIDLGGGWILWALRNCR